MHSPGHDAVSVGHDSGNGGHDPGTVGHDGPKYADCVNDLIDSATKAFAVRCSKVSGWQFASSSSRR